MQSAAAAGCTCVALASDEEGTARVRGVPLHPLHEEDQQILDGAVVACACQDTAVSSKSQQLVPLNSPEDIVPLVVMCQRALRSRKYSKVDERRNVSETAKVFPC